MRKSSDDSLSPEINDLNEDFFGLFTLCPGLVHDTFRLALHKETIPDAAERASELLKRAVSMRQELLSWIPRLDGLVPPPKEIPSPSSDELFPVSLWYEDTMSAAIYCAFYSYMVVVHQILRFLQWPGEPRSTAVYYRNCICRSAEYNGSGILGPFRMGFSLLVAQDAAREDVDAPIREWIQRLIKRLSRSYGALWQMDDPSGDQKEQG